MAYSGLGSGTQADPYQITTISQFMEMNSTSYTTTDYFLLLNDLDFISTDSFSLPNFGCNLDGGGHRLLNMIGASFNGIYIKSSITIKNISFYITRVSGSSTGLTLFNNATSNVTLSNLTLTNIKTFVDPNIVFVYSVNWMSISLKLDSSCVLNNLTIEGYFSYVLPRIYCIVEYCYFNLYNGLISFLDSFDSPGIIRYCYINILAVTETYYTNKTEFIRISKNGLISNNIIRIPYFFQKNTPTTFGLVNPANDCKIQNNLFISKEIYSQLGKNYVIGNGYPSTSGGGFSYNFFTGNINTPAYPTSKVFWDYASGYDNYITSNFYQKSKIVSNTPTDVAGKQVGLTDEQCLQESSFTGWDFTNVWQMGAQYPILRNVTKPLFYYSDNRIAVSCTRLNTSSFNCQVIISDNSIEYGVDFYDSIETTLLFSYSNAENININGLTSDTTFIIKPYLYYNSVKIYQNKISYTHYFVNTAVSITKVTSATYSALTNGSLNGRYIHGSCVKGDYIYGSSRGDTSNNTNYCSIVKIPISNPTGFTLINIYGNSSNSKVADMDSLVPIGDYLYTFGYDTGSSGNTVLVKYNTINDTYQVFKIGTGTGNGYPSTSGGGFLYVYANSAVIKIDPSIFSSPDQFNIFSLWNSGFIYYYPSSQLTDSSLNPHTMVVDNDYLYIGFGTSSSTGQHEIHKIRKSDMTFVSKAFVPKMTDDMCQTATHLFIGIELYTPTNTASFGYGWGTCAIRKSDMAVTKIPKLHSTQRDNQSYASLIFGNYLVDGRNTSGYIYVVDISDVDNWSLSENVGQRTVAAYQVYRTDGTTLSNPVNEIFLTESGRFIGFGWSSISDVLSFDLPGVNFFAIPTVLSLAAHIINNNQIQLAGNVFYNGGQSVTSQGFIISPNSDLSGGTIYNCDSLADFTKVIDALPNGTYYWTAFAVNATGQSAADKKVFSFTKYNSRLKIVIAGQSFYSENNQIYALKEV